MDGVTGHFIREPLTWATIELSHTLARHAPGGAPCAQCREALDLQLPSSSAGSCRVAGGQLRLICETTTKLMPTNLNLVNLKLTTLQNNCSSVDVTTLSHMQKMYNKSC